MHIIMSKTKTILFLVSCWLTTFVIMYQLPQYVITNDLFQSFPEDSAIITAMLSFPALLTAVASLIGGALLRKVTTKFLLIVSVLCSIFMMFCAVPNSAMFLLICTLICAFGAGFANTAGMALLCEVFVDPDARSKQMGFYNGMMAAIGGGMSYVAGLASVNGWQGFTYAYWIAIPALVLTIIFVPNVRPQDRPTEADEVEAVSSTGGLGKGFGVKFWLFFAAMFLFFMVYVPFSTYVSVYVAELGGDATHAANITSAGMILGIFVNMAFGFFYGKVRRKLSIIVLALDILVILVGLAFPCIATAALVCIVLTLSYGQLYSLCYAYSAEIVPAEKNGVAMGLMTFCYSVAILVGVYACDFLMVGNGGLVPCLQFYAILAVVVLAMEVAGNALDRRGVQVQMPQH